MRLLNQNRSWLFAVLVMVFFVCARAGSLAHAAKYGSAPHDHDNTICVFSVFSDEEEDDLALPPEHVNLSTASCTFAYGHMSVESVWTKQTIIQTARAPPGH